MADDSECHFLIFAVSTQQLHWQSCECFRSSHVLHCRGPTFLKCQGENDNSNVTCPEWIQGSQDALSSGTSRYQYGLGVAYPPKTVMSNLSVGQHLRIISNRKSPLPMPPIWVVDQVGQKMIVPGLEANVTVVSLNPPLLPNGTLLDQVRATGDADGDFIFHGTVLLAAPGMYNLTVSVTEVGFSPSYQLFSKLPHTVVQEHVEHMSP